MSNWTAREARRETRYPTNDEATVSAGPPSRHKQHCKILNISRSGLQLELGSKLVVHDRVEIAIAGGASGGVVIFGEIRYCHRDGKVFHAGVEIHDAVFDRSRVSDHIDEDRLSLYATGVGLTALEVLRIKRHLERCPQCIAALTKATEILRREQGEKSTEP